MKADYPNIWTGDFRPSFQVTEIVFSWIHFIVFPAPVPIKKFEKKNLSSSYKVLSRIEELSHYF
jgi:hypothetical protein